MFGVVAIVIIRWASHIPFFMTTSAKGYYNAAVSLRSFYDTIPHGHAFLHGLAINGYMSYIVAFWNLFMFALTGFASMGEGVSILAIIGLVDLGFAVLLMTGVIMESRYLPINLSSCEFATTWRPNTSGKSFFQAAQSLPKFAAYHDADAICRSMVETWALQVAVVGVLFITAILNLRAGLHQVDIDWSSFVPSKTALRRYLTRCLRSVNTLQQCIPWRRKEREQAYVSVKLEEMMADEDDIGQSSDSEPDVGKERVEDKV